MKKLFLLLGLFLISCSEPGVNAEPASPLIYVSIASHNEEPSLRQPDYLADEAGYIEKFREQIEALSAYTEEDIIEWVTLTEVLEIWETNYNSESSILYYNEEASEEIFSDDSSSKKPPFKK